MEELTYYYHYDSPLGTLLMVSDGKALTELDFMDYPYGGDKADMQNVAPCLPAFADTCRWLDLYFAGRVPDFTPPLSLNGTAFQNAVWDILRTIPYGQTTTYGEIAGQIVKLQGVAKMSAQAVGGALGHNPIAIIVPCHRVIGKDGRLTGYTGGLQRKEWLLRHEGFFA